MPARDVKVRSGMTRTLLTGEIMRRTLRTVHEDESLSLASWEMELDEIRHLLVVDHQGQLVGIVSDRDVTRALAARGNLGAPIGKIMNREVQTATADTPAVVVIERMVNGKFSAIPIVDASRRPIGIVTATDIMVVAHRALSGLPFDQPPIQA